MNNSMRAISGQGKERFSHIKGWGVDLDGANRPGIPRELNQENVLSPNHHRAIRSKQKPGPNVNLTLERSEITPVMGNARSPELVSQFIRKAAFTFSEDSLRHWMLLLMADRLNMMEGWIEDILKGQMPMLLPRMESRTGDHFRRMLQQGPKSKQEKAMVAAAAFTLLGAGFLAYRLVSRSSKR